MRPLKTFFYALVNSFRPSYYNDVVKAPTDFSLKYFVFLNFLLSLLMLAVVMPPVLQFNSDKIGLALSAFYPDELVITGDETGIHINQERPYRIYFPTQKLTEIFPDAFKYSDLQYFDQQAFVTFDTDENIQTVQDFERANTLIMVTDSQMFHYEDADGGQVTVTPIGAIEEPFMISKTDINNGIDHVMQHPFIAQKQYIWAIALLVILVAFPATLLGRMLAVAIYSLALWLITTIFMGDKKLDYGKHFQIGLHTITLPVLAAIIIDLSPLAFGLQGMLFFLVYLGWTLVAISSIQTQPTATPAKAAPKKTLTRKKK